MPSLSRIVLGGFFLAAGALHFIKPRAYESIMPEALPAHRELVYLSGVAEMAGGAGEDPDIETIGNHLTSRATFADGDWSLEEAADAMASGGFRHLVVVEGGELVGIISMRDIIAVWRPK